jgi:hypothetical protein
LTGREVAAARRILDGLRSVEKIARVFWNSAGVPPSHFRHNNVPDLLCLRAKDLYEKIIW